MRGRVRGGPVQGPRVTPLSPAPGALKNAPSPKSPPVLIADRGVYAEQTRRNAWESVITVGYSVTDTFDPGEAGPNPLSVVSPCGSRPHRSKPPTPYAPSTGID